MVGRTLMHYKVLAELGAGGMGVVYEAVDLRLDRRVALKILPADKSDDQERRARFLHEARTASALNDPHIVTIFDIFTVDDTDALVMELVQGRTLREILNDGRMPLSKALDVAIQVAEGVAAAHAAGIVHRDMKPGNVMVTERGRVKVLDFGLAKFLGGSLADQPTTLAPATVAGMLLGTVDYMSPEQARGDAIDARTDVFSLGAMLYEMIAGVRPFTAGHALGVLHEIAYGAIVPLRTRRPEASADIERIVLRALERDASRRYQTMDEFGSDLRRAHRDVLAGAPTEMNTPAVAFTPPPLPPLPLPPAQPGLQASATDQPPARPSAPAPSVAAPFPRAARGPRSARRMRKRGSRWVTFGIVMTILFSVNGTRNWLFHRTGVERSSDGADEAPAADSSNFGDNIEDAIARGLLSVASRSADIQFASANIYWKRAQRTKEPAYLRRAEDAFNEALRLGLKDANDEKEAREALRQIAVLKASPVDAPAGDDVPPVPETPPR